MSTPGPTRGAKGASAPRLVACLLALLTTIACSEGPRRVAEGVGTPTVLSSADVHVVGTSESLARGSGPGGGRDGGPWVFDLRRHALVRISGPEDESHLPDRFDAFRFTADRIWGIQRDELDVASVAWIELP